MNSASIFLWTSANVGREVALAFQHGCMTCSYLGKKHQDIKHAVEIHMHCWLSNGELLQYAF